MHDLTVYFDGSCPLCQREIALYRRCKGAERICWVNVAEDHETNLGPDLSQHQALSRFHVRLKDGSLRDGGTAFVHLWRHLAAFRWLGILFDRPKMRSLIEWAYKVFLRLRPTLHKVMRTPFFSRK